MATNNKWLTIIGVAFLALWLSGCQRKDDSQTGEELVIFHAGSLSVPFREISAAFNEKYPNVAVKAEADGSRSCARKISDLNKPCDIMASADYKVVSNLLMPDYADFNIQFAYNEMAIAYTENSRYASEINSGNWQEILLKDDVAFGRSDPDLDPCGYRTLMTFQLAQKHYAIDGLAEKLQSKDRYIRPKETDLLALLEAGEIDYMFIYRSVAIQHGLKTLLLDDEINLKSPEMADIYSTASVKVSGKKPGDFLTRTGEAMIYSVTICKNAPNPDIAANYLEFLLSPEGNAIMQKNGQETITPPRVFGYENLPEKIKQTSVPVN
jgi:molybdate/tungstate transport system substrate-binding protein